MIQDEAIQKRLRKDLDVSCVKMEAAGLMDEFLCLVIRGYAAMRTTHKILFYEASFFEEAHLTLKYKFSSDS